MIPINNAPESSVDYAQGSTAREQASWLACEYFHELALSQGGALEKVLTGERTHALFAPFRRATLALPPTPPSNHQ